MDANLIYTKTPSGEEAVRQRTRVVQRNTRMVLILVDGKSSVADLCEKTGNPQLVDSALQELERDGLIAPKLEQDSLWEQSRKVAEEIRAAAVKRLPREEKAPAEPGLALPATPPVESRGLLPRTPAESREPFSIGPASISPVSNFPFPHAGAEPSSGRFSAPEPVSALPQTPAEPATAVAAGKGPFVRADGDMPKPIRRSFNLPYISWPLAVVIVAASSLLVVLLVFLFYPYDRHRTDIEAALSGLVGQNVRIGRVAASFSPSPAIALESISIGESGEARVTKIRLVPKLVSLFGGRTAYSNVEVESAVLDGAVLAMFPRALGAAMRSDSPTVIDRVGFSRLGLSLLGIAINDLHGEILRADGGGSLSLFNADRSLRLVVKGDGTNGAVDFEGYGWGTSADSLHRFDSILGQAEWNGRSLAIRKLDARIFDGAVRGALVLDRQGELPTMTGDLEVKSLSVARLMAALGYPSQFDGEMAGSIRFSSRISDWATVLRTVSGDGEFSVQRGMLGGMDLVEAVRRAGKAGGTGGATRYENLTGRILLSPQSVRLANLALESGALRANGGLDVARDGKLSGRLDVEIRGSATVLRAPVTLGATLRSPELKAGR